MARVNGTGTAMRTGLCTPMRTKVTTTTTTLRTVTASITRTRTDDEPTRTRREPDGIGDLGDLTDSCARLRAGHRTPHTMAPTLPDERDGLNAPSSPGELFRAFAWISMQSFGGALAFIERVVVRDKRWLSQKDFVGLFAVGQVLPGPTGLSFCVLLGDRFFGWRGAVAAVGGFVLLPSVIVIGAAALFQRFQHVSQVQGALHGMGAASIGLFVITAARMSGALRGSRVGIAVALASFAMVALARLPVSSVMLTLGVLSVAWAWRSLR